MIHNQEVNNDLESRGIKFIMDTDGTQLIPWESLTSDDVVIIPAFGTTIEIEHRLLDMGIEVQKYNTTCPFVEKVWNRADKLGKNDYTVIIHGKPQHEETRATFSHSERSSASVIVSDIRDAQLLGEFIKGIRPLSEFKDLFEEKSSTGFDPVKDLEKVGVVNQTTMLASETQEIADYFRNLMIEKHGLDKIKDHFADTRDTLCYATNDNQDATYELLKTDADMAFVVGGYNSSNTSHIVELCERKFPTYFINTEKEIVSPVETYHFNIHTKNRILSKDFLPEKSPIRVVLTSGASCPDTLVDRVMLRLLEFYQTNKTVEELISEF